MNSKENHIQRQFKGLLKSDFWERKPAFWMTDNASNPIEKDRYFSTVINAMERMINKKPKINRFKEIIKWITSR
jgi:hypothetical protein